LKRGDRVRVSDVDTRGDGVVVGKSKTWHGSASDREQHFSWTYKVRTKNGKTSHHGASVLSRRR